MRKTPPSFRLQFIGLALIRLVMNINVRIMYPFLPFFASGLGVSVKELSLALTTRSLVGALNPLAASAITDRRGRKTGMLVGIGLFTIANLAVVIWPLYPVLFVSLTVSMFGMFIFSPAMQAYMSDTIAYEQRGRAIALTEMAWSASYFIGMPLAAFLLSRWGWIGPFPLLAGLGALSFLLVARLAPGAPAPGGSSRGSLSDLRRVLAYRPAQAALLMGFFFSVGSEMLAIVFGVWMKASFGLEILGLGLVSTLIGVAEFSGESLTAGLVDRLGKKRSIRIGLLVDTFFVILLLLAGKTMIGAMGALFGYYLAHEFMIVSTLPLMSEVMPSARATMLSLMAAFLSLGRSAAALVALRVYEFGFHYNVIIIVCVNLLALFMLGRIRLQWSDNAVEQKGKDVHGVEETI